MIGGTREYWARVRSTERDLPPVVWLVSVEGQPVEARGGVVFQAAAGLAAKLITDGHARRATPEETVVHEAGEAARRAEAEEVERRRRGVTRLVVSLPEPEPKAVSRKR